MSVTVIREQEVLREAVGVLWEHLGPAKAVRLWATWQRSEGAEVRGSRGAEERGGNWRDVELQPA